MNVGKTRTFFDMDLVMGMPVSPHKHSLFLAFPFEHKKPSFPTIRTLLDEILTDEMRGLHPIYRAIAWKQILNENPWATSSQIAECEGVHRDRVNQIMRMARLAPEIQDFLKALNHPKELRFFGEGKIRGIAPLAQEMQHEQFQMLQEKWEQKMLNSSL